MKLKELLIYPESWDAESGQFLEANQCSGLTFPEIFDYITKNSCSYSLNTNGTLITPEIAALMKRKGSKMISLYGATAEIHDHITRNPGSFKATLKGFRLLQEVGADFIVQIVPMKDNYHQLEGNDLTGQIN